MVDDVGWGKGVYKGVISGRRGGDDGVTGRNGVFDGKTAAGTRAAIDKDFLIPIRWRRRTREWRA